MGDILDNRQNFAFLSVTFRIFKAFRDRDDDIYETNIDHFLALIDFL